MNNDPLYMLMESRGELDDADIDAYDSQLASNSARKSTFEMERTNCTAGAADYELREREFSQHM